MLTLLGGATLGNSDANFNRRGERGRWRGLEKGVETFCNKKSQFLLRAKFKASPALFSATHGFCPADRPAVRPIGFVALKPDFCHEFDVGTVAGPTCRYGNYWVPQCGTQWYPRYLWVLLGTNRGCYVLLGTGY